MKTLAERREYQRRYWETHTLSRKLRREVFLCPWRHSDGCMFQSTDPATHHAHIHEHELKEMVGRVCDDPFMKPNVNKQAVLARAKRLEVKP